MQNGIFFSIISLVYCILVFILFFSKEKIKTKENKIYGALLIINLIGIFIEVVPATLAIRGIVHVSENTLILILKLILIYLVIWSIIFTYYIIVISIKDVKKIRFFKLIGILLGFFSLILILLLR